MVARRQRDKQTHKRHYIGDYTNAISASIAALALIVSVRSCYTADRASQEVTRQYTEERQLVLSGVFADNEAACADWHVKPIADGFEYGRGRVFLPGAIFKSAITIDAGGWVHFLHGACKALDDYAASRADGIAPGHVAVGDGDIPIVIESFYAVKGNAYTDASLYYLNVISSTPPINEGLPRVKLTGLTFVRRLREDKRPYVDLLDSFAKGRGQPSVR